MDATLPCTIFKALCAVSLDVELLRWPLLGVVFVCVQLAAASVASKLFFPDAVRQKTARYQLATAAPGLSAFRVYKRICGRSRRFEVLRRRTTGSSGGGFLTYLINYYIWYWYSPSCWACRFHQCQSSSRTR